MEEEKRNPYEKDMEIDPNALDIECLEQANLMLRYSTICANWEREAARLKEKLALIDAKLDADIRANPEKYKISKITEPVVANTILTLEEHQLACAEYWDAKYEHGVAKGAVDAVSERKDMLESLIKLHGQQYFAGPSVPRDLGYEQQQKYKQKSVDRDISRKMSRK